MPPNAAKAPAEFIRWRQSATLKEKQQAKAANFNTIAAASFIFITQFCNFASVTCVRFHTFRAQVSYILFPSHAASGNMKLGLQGQLNTARRRGFNYDWLRQGRPLGHHHICRAEAFRHHQYF